MRSPKISIFTCLLTLALLVGLPSTPSHANKAQQLPPGQALAFLQDTPTQPKTDSHKNGRPPSKVPDPCNHVNWLVAVAHPDDDLLFMNPDIANVLLQGGCVRTVYVTGGDDGRDPAYVVSREHGVQAAYSIMAATSAEWSYHALDLPSGAQVITASPTDMSRITHVYLHLPDGNLDGRGFPATGNQSLRGLLEGALPSLSAFGSPGDYTADSLTSTLVELMRHYRPNRVITLSAQDSSYPDHSDHRAVAQLTARATYIAEARMKHPIKDGLWEYSGYPIHQQPANLSPAQVTQKSLPFFAYAHYDPGVCNTLDQCEQSASSYTPYLFREYKKKVSNQVTY